MTARERFLSLKSKPRKKLDMPALGDDIYIKTWSAAERDRYETEQFHAGAGINYRPRLIVHSVVDSEGNSFFTDSDISELAEMPAYLLDAISEEVTKLNKISAKDLAEYAKN